MGARTTSSTRDASSGASRRELLTTGLGAAAMVAMTTGTGDAAAAASGPTLAARERDAKVLERLLEAERLLDFAYTRVLDSRVLRPDANDVVLLAYGYQQDHAAALRGHLRALQAGLPARAAPRPASGKQPPFPPPKVASLFQTLRKETFAVMALMEVSSFVMAKYFNGVAALAEPDLIRTVTQILACKAQQWSLLQDMYSHGGVIRTVPTAFVRGSASLGPG